MALIHDTRLGKFISPIVDGADRSVYALSVKQEDSGLRWVECDCPGYVDFKSCAHVNNAIVESPGLLRLLRGESSTEIVFGVKVALTPMSDLFRMSQSLDNFGRAAKNFEDYEAGFRASLKEFERAMGRQIVEGIEGGIASPPAKEEPPSEGNGDATESKTRFGGIEL